MGDTEGDDDEFCVLDGVDDAVVADPDAPQSREADECPRGVRSRVELQRINGLDDASRDGLVKLGQLLQGARGSYWTMYGPALLTARGSGPPHLRGSR